jgi:hypothetical protein
LCSLLTVERMDQHPDFENWTVSKGRWNCFQDLLAKLEPVVLKAQNEQNMNQSKSAASINKSSQQNGLLQTISMSLAYQLALDTSKQFSAFQKPQLTQLSADLGYLVPVGHQVLSTGENHSKANTEHNVVRPSGLIQSPARFEKQITIVPPSPPSAVKDLERNPQKLHGIELNGKDEIFSSFSGSPARAGTEEVSGVASSTASPRLQPSNNIANEHAQDRNRSVQGSSVRVDFAAEVPVLVPKNIAESGSTGPSASRKENNLSTENQPNTIPSNEMTESSAAGLIPISTKPYLPADLVILEQQKQHHFRHQRAQWEIPEAPEDRSNNFGFGPQSSCVSDNGLVPPFHSIHGSNTHEILPHAEDHSQNHVTSTKDLLQRTQVRPTTDASAQLVQLPGSGTQSKLLTAVSQFPPDTSGSAPPLTIQVEGQEQNMGIVPGLAQAHAHSSGAMLSAPMSLRVGQHYYREQPPFQQYSQFMYPHMHPQVHPQVFHQQLQQQGVVVAPFSVDRFGNQFQDTPFPLPPYTVERSVAVPYNSLQYPPPPNAFANTYSASPRGIPVQPPTGQEQPFVLGQHNMQTSQYCPQQQTHEQAKPNLSPRIEVCHTSKALVQNAPVSVTRPPPVAWIVGKELTSDANHAENTDDQPSAPGIGDQQLSSPRSALGTSASPRGESKIPVPKSETSVTHQISNSQAPAVVAFTVGQEDTSKVKPMPAALRRKMEAEEERIRQAAAAAALVEKNVLDSRDRASSRNRPRAISTNRGGPLPPPLPVTGKAVSGEIQGARIRPNSAHRSRVLDALPAHVLNNEMSAHGNMSQSKLAEPIRKGVDVSSVRPTNISPPTASNSAVRTFSADSSVGPVSAGPMEYKKHVLYESNVPLRCASTLFVDYNHSGKVLVAVGSNAKSVQTISYSSAVLSARDVEFQVEKSFEKVHNGSVYCMDWHEASGLLASGSNDKAIRLLK